VAKELTDVHERVGKEGALTVANFLCKTFKVDEVVIGELAEEEIRTSHASAYYYVRGSYHCAGPYDGCEPSTIRIMPLTTVGCVIHEFAHHLHHLECLDAVEWQASERFASRNDYYPLDNALVLRGRRHGVGFYRCLLRSIAVCPIWDYSWEEEYRHLRGWAFRDGFYHPYLDSMLASDYRARLEEMEKAGRIDAKERKTWQSW
jgi:hypothetical protein